MPTCGCGNRRAGVLVLGWKNFTASPYEELEGGHLLGEGAAHSSVLPLAAGDSVEPPPPAAGEQGACRRGLAFLSIAGLLIALPGAFVLAVLAATAAQGPAPASGASTREIGLFKRQSAYLHVEEGAASGHAGSGAQASPNLFIDVLDVLALLPNDSSLPSQDAEWDVLGNRSHPVSKEEEFKNVRVTTVIGHKQPGARVAGVREGNRVVLAGEPGYMEITDPDNRTHDPLLRRRNASFARVRDGACEKSLCCVIEDPVTCQAARLALELANFTVKVLNASHEGPAGCAVENTTWHLCYVQPCHLLGLGDAQGHNGQKATSAGAAGAGAEAPPAVAPAAAPAAALVAAPKAGGAASRGCGDGGGKGGCHGAGTNSTQRNETLQEKNRTVHSNLGHFTNLSGYPSLYCFVVIRAKSYELDIMRFLHKENRSIFSCNEWSVFSDEPAEVGDGWPTEVNTGPPATFAGIWLNTDVFFRAWYKIFGWGAYKSQEWTVKVDPDAVFFPERLRWHLKQTGGNGWAEKKYYKNCAQFFSMQGPLEVFSFQAVTALSTDAWRCFQVLDKWHYGEDQFMHHCMDVLGVWGINDFGLLIDQYCGGQPRPCTNTWAAAFHPFKSLEDYSKCSAEAEKAIAK